jgi:integrase
VAARTAIVLDLRSARMPGGRLRISLRTSNRSEARRRENAVRVLVERGEWAILERLRAGTVHVAEVQRAVEANQITTLRPPPGGYALGIQIDRLLERVPAGSRPNYEGKLGALRLAFGDDYPMERMTREAALAWLHSPQPTNGNRVWAPGTRKLAAVLCGRLWDEAIYAAREAAELTDDRPALVRNPWKHVGPGRGTQEDIRPRQAYLQPKQWARLLASVRGTERAVLYGMGALAGLRLREALYLRPGIDVEIPASAPGRIRVQPRAGEYPWKPKRKRSVRDVPICPQLRRLIDEHIAAGYAGERYLIRAPRTDAPLPRQTADHWVRADFPAAGLVHGRDGDGLTFHSTRHTFASWLVQADISLLKVARLIGDTVEMVEKVYGHLAPGDLDRAIGIIEEVAKNAASSTPDDITTTGNAHA